MRPTSITKRPIIAGLASVAMAVMTSCTTFIQPTTCEPGSTSCAGIHDARFCEYQVLAVEGAECASLGIAASKPFCVVTTTACTETNYAVKDHDCKVLRYETVRDAMRDECPSGAPMFVNR